MKQFFTKTLNRNAYLLLAAIGLFLVAFLLNKYLLGTTSTHYYTRLIQSRIHEKENDFIRLTKDTALLHSLISDSFSEDDLEEMIERGYYIFLYGDSSRVASPRLLFWNTQEVLPEMPGAWIYFVTFILLGTFVALNFFVGVIVNNLQSVTIEQERDDLAEIRAALARLETRLQTRPANENIDQRATRR